MTAAHPTISRHSTSHGHRWVIPAGFVWAIGVLLWALCEGLLPQSNQARVISLAAILAALGLIGAAATSGETDLRTALARLKLGPWMGIGFSLGFGLTTLAWLGDIRAYNGQVADSSLAPAGIVAGAGYLALVLAYQSTPQFFREWGRNLDRRLRGGGYLSPSSMGVWTLWAVSMLAEAADFARGNVGYLADSSAALSTSSSANAALFTLTQLGLLATLTAGLRFVADRRPGTMALLIWVASSQLALGLFSGMKEAAVIQMVAVVVGLSGRGRLRLVPMVIIGFVTLFAVTPFVTSYRSAVINGSGRLSPVQAVRTVRFDRLISEIASGTATVGSLGDSSGRWSRIGDVAIIVAKTPSVIEYVSSTELLSGPLLGFVPRSIWPDKPVLDAGYQVSQQYYEMPASVYSSAALTPYGDLYRHGGLGIVILGMAFLGMFVRAIDDRAGTEKTADPRVLFLPMLLFTTLVKQEMDYLALSASLVSIILTAALAARLVSRRTVPNS